MAEGERGLSGGAGDANIVGSSAPTALPLSLRDLTGLCVALVMTSVACGVVWACIMPVLGAVLWVLRPGRLGAWGMVGIVLMATACAGWWLARRMEKPYVFLGVLTACWAACLVCVRYLGLPF